jgi:hypothetical protein
MSHFTTIKTRIVSKEHLLEALDDLNMTYEIGDLEIRGYGGIRTHVEIKVPTAAQDYQIGFRKKGDAYEIVADWYGIKDIRQEEFISKVTQRYAYRAALKQLEAQDFAVVSQEIGPDNSIHITLRRMV